MSEVERAKSNAILSPVAMLDLARRFCDGADVLEPGPGVVPEHYPVGHYLYGHSIELGLKAFLCAEGWDEQRLRRLNHDLVACLEASSAAGLAKHVAVDERAREAISLLNGLYSDKALEYSPATPPGGGLLESAPLASDLRAIARALTDKLRGHCLAALKRMRNEAKG